MESVTISLPEFAPIYGWIGFYVVSAGFWGFLFRRCVLRVATNFKEDNECMGGAYIPFSVVTGVATLFNLIMIAVITTKMALRVL
jgi:hypothetical protein